MAMSSKTESAPKNSNLLRRPENINDFPDGLWVPLSHTLTDLARDSLPPFADEIYKISFSILDQISKDKRFKLMSRGSTLPYAFLNTLGQERRGALTNGVFFQMYMDMNKIRGSRIWRVLTDIPMGSDNDFFVQGTNKDNFQDFKSHVVEILGKNLFARPFWQKLKKGHDDFWLLKPQFWSKYSANPIRHIKSLLPGRQAALIHIIKSSVNGIEYIELPMVSFPLKELLTKGLDKNTVQLLGKNFFAIGDWSTINPKDSPLEDRRDAKYSLSWDALTFGELVRLSDIPDSELRKRVENRVAEGKKHKLGTKNPAGKRLLQISGTFTPESFADANELYFHFPKQSLEVLTKPIEVGNGFKELSPSRQFLLALRAAQKGAMYEDLLQYSNEGRETLKSNRKAKAISNDALDIFQSISLSDFRNEFNQMSEKERNSFNEYVMKYMLTGLYYPQRFLNYLSEIGILKFFPGLSHLNSKNIEDIINKLPNWEQYTGNLHKSSHHHEVHSEKIGIGYGVLDNDSLARELEREIRWKQWQNPYKLFIDTLEQLNLIPNIPENYLAKLDLLLELDPKKGFNSLFNKESGNKPTYHETSKVLFTPYVFHPAWKPQMTLTQQEQFEKELEQRVIKDKIHKFLVPAFLGLGALGFFGFDISLAIDPNNVSKTISYLFIALGLPLSLASHMIAGINRLYIKNMQGKLSDKHLKS